MVVCNGRLFFVRCASCRARVLWVVLILATSKGMRQANMRELRTAVVVCSGRLFFARCASCRGSLLSFLSVATSK